MDLHPQSIELANAFISNFWSADHSIRWSSAEQEILRWLDESTALVGRVDARGTTEDGHNFFAEWKTMNERRARFMPSIKAEWRMDPQALTYGVLVPNTRMFTVRWAIKSTPPKFDFEWYTYTDAEVDWWANELLDIANTIRRLRRDAARVERHVGGQWPTNITNCLRYGQKYACPFLEPACSKLNFSANPDVGGPRVPHLSIEQELRSTHLGDRDFVVLDATRVETWLTCSEKYRRQYEGAGWGEENEALTIGKDFHTIIGSHITKIMEEQNVREEELTLVKSENPEVQSTAR